MTMKIAISAFLLAAFATPSFALSMSTPSTTFYVAQDVKTKKCSIVDKKPTDITAMTIVGDSTAYPTHAAAETAMKAAKVCVSG